MRRMTYVGEWSVMLVALMLLAYALLQLNGWVSVPVVDDAQRGQIIPSRPTYDPQLALTFNEADRDLWQKPEQVLDAVGDISGLRVADIGCGEGYFTTRLVERVGPLGMVFATDIQEEMLNQLHSRIPPEHAGRLVTVLAPPDQIGFSEVVDIIFMVQVLGEIQDQEAYLQQVKNVMHDASRLVFIDSRTVVDATSGYSYPLNFKVLIESFERLGFELAPDGSHNFLPRQCFFVFRVRSNRE
ncbi:MAG: class I SAM-dependent methyltransferase [Acidobacteria bacterium]|nr:class I SAM-dependent methyltransferase [Acidobacteriota bacterium]